MTFVAVVVLGYLLGSCPWGYWLVLLVEREDIRKVGSGNIGATNVWRTYGRGLGLPVVVLDTLKGFVPAFLGLLLVSHFAGICAGAAAMIGHGRPLFLRFAKGGKVVATTGGVFFGVAVWVALAAGLVWVATFLLFRYASVASVVAGIALPIAAAAFGYPTSVIVFAAGAALAILYLHRGNLRRLRAGTEHRFRLRRPASA
ncbi:MAG TPA: glycerol-3-phosphate 1-O-acyltransferase PlsY [Gaiellaceae bacterium]|jgi:glycerol-3-phosphate acyltransferase PlsY